MTQTGIHLMLEAQLDSASVAERNLIRHILSDPVACLGISIQELAKRSYTSPATIVRFCKKVGCSGYRDFQQALVFAVANQQHDAKVAMSAVSAGDSAENIIRKVTAKNIESLESSMALADAGRINQAVDLIEKARQVNLFGIGSSLLVAKDFELKLLRVDKPCKLCDDWHSQLLYAMNMQADSLAIAISYSGHTKEVLECCKRAKRNGAPIIAITRAGADTPLIHLADIVLQVAATEHLLRPSAAASRIAQLNVVDILYATYIARNWERSEARISTNYIQKSTEETTLKEGL